jgi:NADH dehydrogenase/NADH:ubiquinone oxidoreductase subunit G
MPKTAGACAVTLNSSSRSAETQERGATMITIEADGRTIRANEGDTILAALRSEGIHVPTLCHLEGLPPSGACRMCVVEVEGAPTLTPACSFPVATR